METLNCIIDIVVAGFGFYVLYTVYQMKTKGIIAKNIYLSKDLMNSKCKNPEEFIAFLIPRSLVAGILLILIGGISALSMVVPAFAVVSSWSFMPVLLVLVWFMFFTRKACERWYR